MISSNFPSNRKYPSSNRLFFLPGVVKPGRYGTSSDTVVLLPNNAKLIKGVLDRFEEIRPMILAFDAGGYNIIDTVSFKSSTRKCVLEILKSEMVPENIEQTPKIYVPISLASSVNIKNDEILSGWRICYCDDNLDALVEGPLNNEDIEGVIPRKSITFLKRLAARFFMGAKSLILQLIAFIIPILIIDPKLFTFIGVVSILSAICLLLFWELYPGKGILKGVINSLVVGFLLWLFLQGVFPLIDVGNYWFLFVTLSCNIWLSIVFSGYRWS